MKRYKVFVMLLRGLTRLSLALGAALSLGFAEQQLLCSSDSIAVWCAYEGPLHHLSVSVDPCTNRMKVLNANYTLITKFTIARIGYHIAIYYKRQLWLEFFQPLVPCKGFRICSVIKGETLSESLSLPVKGHYAVEGEYELLVYINIIDDLEREITVTVNCSMHVRNGEGEGEGQFHHVKAP